jgi:GAF domain-containing protein
VANKSTPAGTLDPDFLQGVVRQASYQCRADGSGFYLWDPAQACISLVATHNLPQVPWDDGLPERVIASGETMIEACRDQAACLAAPLIWQDAVRGVLIVFDGNIKRTFRERDTALLQSLADMTAAVAQQNERLARMTTQFRTLHAIDVALTSSLELERVLNLILEKAAVRKTGAQSPLWRRLDIRKT